jgi:hypothetical protein
MEHELTTKPLLGAKRWTSPESYPEFLRLPKSGERCPVTGMSRSSLNLLILPGEDNNFNPPVRSISLRKRGQIRATRLIVCKSLIDYLYSLETQLPLSGSSARSASDYFVTTETQEMH